MTQAKRVYLVLEDGSVFPGLGFGGAPLSVDELEPGAADMRSAGEVVFNTAMGGYHEVLTDPSYTGQLVVMTYPHIGNYGSLGEWSEAGPEDEQERRVKAAGFIVRSVFRGPVPAGRMTLDKFLRDAGIPGISDVDTRALTLKLREEGSLRGVIVAGSESGAGGGAGGGKPGAETLAEAELAQVLEYLRAFPQMLGRNLIGTVGASRAVEISPEGAPHIALLDCGSKANIIRELTSRGCRITVLPHTASAEEIAAAGADTLLVSNGPGDPAVLEGQIELLRGFVGKMPLFGICLGHQLLAHALGGKTEKMKFGHHGVNHPVRDERTGRVFVTSQNHGFTVSEDSLPDGASVWFRNANDGSIEGIAADGAAVYTAQFHPESAPGPHDSAWIFDSFLSHLKRYSEKGA